MKLQAFNLFLLTGSVAFAQYNPAYQNPFPYESQSYYIQENNNVQQNLRAVGDGMAAAGMMARIERLERAAAIENRKYINENEPKFLAGEMPNLPKAQIVEPGLFDSDNLIWIVIPYSNRRYGVDPKRILGKKDWNSFIFGAEHCEPFVINKEEVLEAIRKQEIKLESAKGENPSIQRNNLSTKK